MRQAGRYLDSYKKVRSHFSSFIEFCLTPKAATEVTLQPVKQFDFDAAILFADILLVPYAMGQKIKFISGEGPFLEPLPSLDTISLSITPIKAVFETLRSVKNELAPDKALIGFSGGLWTVACYMMNGKGGTFEGALEKLRKDRVFVKELFDRLSIITRDYLLAQIQAGADVIQIFDSHAGLLKGDDFQEFVIEPTKRLVGSIKEQYPSIPFIGFPRGASLEEYKTYAQLTGIDALSLDQNIDRSAIKRVCPNMILQGNLDPEILVQGGKILKDEIDAIKQDFGGGYIFNLGHGVLPQTPPEHVADLVRWVRS